MSKMISVESCKRCPHCYSLRTLKPEYHCLELWDDDGYVDIWDEKLSLNNAKGVVKITGLSKILPNCPLEDYPKTEGGAK